MSYFLFTWNPEKFPVKYITNCRLEFEEHGKLVFGWNCANRDAKIGDRAFLMKVGKGQRGIFASEIIASDFYIGFRHNLSVDIEFDTFFDFNKKNLSYEYLKSNFKLQNWTPQPSGTSINPIVCESLEKEWFKLTKKKFSKVKNEWNYFEGNISKAIVNKVERNLEARYKCIEEKGYDCTVRGMNFRKIYGELLKKEFIQVHHLTPVSTRKGRYKIDPINDLVPICPNCHVVIHSIKPPYSMDEVKRVYDKLNN